MLDVKVLVRIEENVVAGFVIRIPEDLFNARPPQFVEILALVDHDGIELVLRPQPLTGLHQGLRGHIGPERLIVRVTHLPEGDIGHPAKLADDSMIVVDHEVVAEGLGNRVPQPVLEWAVVTEEERARAVPRDGLRLGERQDRLARARHAADRRRGLVGEDVEDPLLVVGQAPQAAPPDPRSCAR